MPVPLSKQQKTELAMLFNSAHARQSALAAARGETITADADEWRRQEVRTAVQADGLRCCHQGHYCALMAHVHAQLGHEDVALRWHQRAVEEPRRVAEMKLHQIMRQTGKDIRYVATICVAKFKCSPLEASAKQLWSLYYDLKNRAPKPQPTT